MDIFIIALLIFIGLVMVILEVFFFTGNNDCRNQCRSFFL